MVALGIFASLVFLLSMISLIAEEIGRRRRLKSLYKRGKERRIVQTPEELDMILQELGVPAEVFLLTSRDEIIERLGEVAYHTVLCWPSEVGVEVCTRDHYRAGGLWFKGLGQGVGGGEPPLNSDDGCAHYVSDERMRAYPLGEILLHRRLQGQGIWSFFKNL